MSDRMAGLLDIAARFLQGDNKPNRMMAGAHPGDAADLSAMQLAPHMAKGLINDVAKYGSQTITGKVSDGDFLQQQPLTGQAKTIADAVGSGLGKALNYQVPSLMRGSRSVMDDFSMVADGYRKVKPSLVESLGEPAVNRVEGAGLLGSMVIPGRANKLLDARTVNRDMDLLQRAGDVDSVIARQQPRKIETNFSTENVTDKKYLEPILDDLKVDAQRIQYDKPEIYLPDYYGKNALVTMVDRSPTNTQIFGVNGAEFRTPQHIGGGRDYMFDEANSPGVVFANEEGATTSILNRKDQLGDDDMLILPMEMAHTSVDFPDFAPGLHTRYAQVAMSNKDKKYVNKLVNSGGGGYLIKSVDKTPVPDFDIDMEDLDTFLSGLTGPQRKTINNVFDMVNKPSPGQKKQGVKQIEGALSNTEMRAAVSDPEMFNQPSLMQTNNVGVITGGKALSNHNTYNMGMEGLGGGVLNIPREAPPTAQDFLPDLFQLSRPEYIDSKDAYTARMGVRTAKINDGLLRRLGY